MTLMTLSNLFEQLRSGERLVGIDPGSRTIGVALSDVSLTIATPYVSFKRSKLGAFADEILKLAHKESVGGLVVGLPLEMDGGFGPAAQAARDWARSLSEITRLPAALCDERLSSSAVNRFLIGEVDMTRGKRAEVVDRAAAAYMLQGVLDWARQRWEEE